MGNGLVSNKNRPLKDFKGQKLCESCWNGNHYITDTVTKKKIANCFGEPCECHCVRMMQEKHGRPKRDKSLQSVIDTGDDVISIGTPSHRDDA